MPLISKKQQLDRVTLDEDVLKDSDEIFYCEISKEIFRNYEDYFMRVMILNSTVWTCALTSRPNLTYTEALESEKEARRVLRRFAYELKAPLVYVAALTKRRRITDLVDDVFAYVSTRFFREESVNVLDKEHTRECEILSIVHPTIRNGGGDDDPLALDDEELVDPATVQYKVRRIDVVSKKLQEPFVALATHIKRSRTVLSKDKLKLFMKHCVEFNDAGLLAITPASYHKYVTDGGVTKFTDFWVGKQPTFEAPKLAQPKKESKTIQSKKNAQLAKEDKKEKKEKKVAAAKEQKQDKKDKKAVEKVQNGSAKKVYPEKKAIKEKDKSAKQPSISNYFAKNDEAPNKVLGDKKPKISNEQMKKLRQEKEEQEAAEKLRQIEERDRVNSMVAAALRSFSKLGEDLELADQRELPVARPVQTLIPVDLFTDAMFVLEFIFSFSSQLEMTDKFAKGYSLDIIERSLLVPEVAGPLSDTIQVLLGTVFSLQIEESYEMVVEYVKKEHFDNDTADQAVMHATMATDFPQKYLSLGLFELPMDATSVSELLRLHLLTSGACVEDAAAKWRYQQRGGYRNEDDPGLILRKQHPHILRHLAKQSVYQLETVDKIRVLMCLINQILTYSLIRDAIEERLNNAQEARISLRALSAAEKRREVALNNKRRALTEAIRKTTNASDGSAADKKVLKAKLTAEMEDTLKSLEVAGERERTVYNEQVAKLRREIFSYQMQLGTDRAHRSYWLFESLAGVFVMTPNRKVLGPCLASAPIEQIPALAKCSLVDRAVLIKQMTIDKLSNSDKENKVVNNHSEHKVAKVNGVPAKVAEVIDVDADSASDLPSELLMCTGAQDSCPVHGIGAEWTWSFYASAKELDALIVALNPRGFRERLLKEQLETDRELIVNHIQEADELKLHVTEVRRDECLAALLAMPTYAKANLGFPSETTVPVVMEGTLVDYIVALEVRMTDGHLGKLGVADLEAWRQALTYAKDDGQSDALCWGPNDVYNKDNRTGSGDHLFVDPGASLAEPTKPPRRTTAADDEDAQREQRIFFIARCLLQVGRAIEQQFLRAPFGVQNRTNKPNLAVLEKGRQNMQMWQVSLMNATSYAQVFLHYTILEDAIIWSRSSQNANCHICRRRVMPEKMILCENCNRGQHLFCFKPKLTKVPEGQWFCENCKPEEKKVTKKGKRARPIFKINMNSDDEMLLDEEEIKAMRKYNVKAKRFSDTDDDSSMSEVWEDDQDDDDDANSQSISEGDAEPAVAPTKKVAAKPKPAAPSRQPAAVKRKAPVVVVEAASSDDDEDFVHKSSSGGGGLRKRSRRSVQKPVALKDYVDSSEQSDDDDMVSSSSLSEDDDDTDFKEPGRSKAKNKKTVSVTRKKAPSKRKSTRRSTDDDDDDEDTRPAPAKALFNGTHRTSAGRRSRRMDDDNDNLLLLDTVSCYDLLTDLAKHDDVWPFDRPVNKVDVPDYYKVIHHPMDLAKVKSKLNLGEYSSNYDFMNDLQLIFSNCDLYNNSGSPIYTAGVNLERFVRKRCAKLNLPFKASDMLIDDKLPTTPAAATTSSTSSRRSKA